MASFVAFLHRHPVLFLLALTPGIPEYLSGSSSVALLAINPGAFFLFLLLNLGLYGPGVLLLREAWVRLGRSWGALLAFGAAYGILEEGTALSTLFNPNASVVTNLGHYGRAAGVNWVWLLGVLGVHIVYSVGLPIVLLGLALSETRGRSLLGRRQILAAAIVYAVDIGLLAGIERYVLVEPVQIAASVVVALALWGVAFRLPRGTLDPPTERPTRRPRSYLVLGLAFYPALLLVPAVMIAALAPAALTFLVTGVVAVAFFLVVERTLGRHANEPQLVLLALGAIVPIIAFGLLSQIRLPLVLVLDILFGILFARLWRKYRPAPTVPAGAVLADR